MGLLLLAYLAVQHCCSECWCDYMLSYLAVQCCCSECWWVYCWLTWRCSIVVVLSVGGTIVVGLPGGAVLLF